MGQGTVTTNRLIHEQSPYLLQHAHNPVDWYPWGSEALSRAKAEDRPILLSSGYSACHWCHVMERESFTNPRIAQMMNENFVCIKVDREERPDLDETYQTACLLLTGHGGWPLTVFLTPDLKPFYAGTYFPPEDKYGRPGFIRILQTVARVYRTERERVEAIAQDIVKGMKGQLLPENTEPGISLESWDWTDLPREAVSRLKYSYDTRHGGFGDAPKFPTTNLLQLFLHVGYEADPASVDMVVDTLLHMARGGIRDHLGGGFHRYSTDARWLVPHFEKMLYDNALLVPLYLAGYQLTGEPEFREVVESTLQFVASEMTAPGGGFYSSFDADTEGEEGRYYVWRYQEVIDLLGEEPGEILCDYFGISPEGNFAKGTSVLHRSTGEEQLADKYRLSLPGIQDILAQGRAQMLAHRTHREKPFCDTKIITAWNGMMISAFAQAARILDVPGYGKQAEAAAHFILENLMDGRGRLLRAFKDRPSQIPGFLSDYGWLINGLLDLHAATFDHSWLTQARSLTEVMVERFWDEANGGWFDSDEEHDSPLLRTKGITDQSYPSAASQAVLALIRLAEVIIGFLLSSTGPSMSMPMRWPTPLGCAC